MVKINGYLKFKVEMIISNSIEVQDILFHGFQRIICSFSRRAGAEFSKEKRGFEGELESVFKNPLKTGSARLYFASTLQDILELIQFMYLPTGLSLSRRRRGVIWLVLRIS